MKVMAVFKRVIKEMVHDKRTLLLMFIAPLVVMTLLNFLFKSTTTENANLATQNVDHVLVKNIKTKHLKITEVGKHNSAKQLIEDGKYDGLLKQKHHRLTLTLQNTDQSKKAVIVQSLRQGQVKLAMKGSRAVIKTESTALKEMSGQLKKITQTAIKANPQMAQQLASNGKSARSLKKPVVHTYKVKTKYLYGDKNTNYFDTLLPIMISFIVFFFVFLITGMSLLNERNRGTLGRILATPIKKGELISGYILGYGLFAIIQTLEIVLFTIYVFRVEVIGSVWTILALNILVAFVALSLGLWLSAFASSEFQMMQFIPMIIIPQVFFAGIIPVSSMADWLQWLAHIMPLYYVGNTMLNIVQKGYNLIQIGPSCLILLLFGLLFMWAAVIEMRKFREV